MCAIRYIIKKVSFDFKYLKHGSCIPARTLINMTLMYKKIGRCCIIANKTNIYLRSRDERFKVSEINMSVLSSEFLYLFNLFF